LDEDELELELFRVVSVLELELAREPELLRVGELLDPEPAREVELLRVVDDLRVVAVDALGLEAPLDPPAEDLARDTGLASTTPSASWWSSSHSPVIRSRCSVDRSSL
jgi:hypothetical protein